MMHPIRDLGDGKMNKIQSLSLGNQAVMFVYFLSFNTLQSSLYLSLKKKNKGILFIRFVPGTMGAA